ncbi:MAG TPA: FAD-binding oxidoreductase [Candidatus Methylomirabilis sp.]|nr:FAD-binding oxidoreductase [Candidatus Methylomirabilis sp.]
MKSRASRLFPLPFPPDDNGPIPAYFESVAPPAPATEKLDGDRQADVVIVGGGYTGLSTAVHLAERGIRAVVLEARDIGWGESSRSFGQVVPYLKHPPVHLARQLGAEVAERLVEATGRGPDLVFALIDKHRIDCSAVRKGLIFGAHSPAGFRTLEARTTFWQKRGAAVEMLDRRRTEALTGTRYYAASSLDPRGGTINPLGYVRGLARAAIEVGATVYAHTPMTGLTRVGTGWRVEALGGHLLTRTVVLATNAYTTSPVWPGLYESLIPMRAYQMVSAPLGEGVRDRILPGGQPLTDTRRLFSGVRRHQDGRIHVSADGPVFDMNGAADVAKVNRRLATLFPQLGPLEWEYRWTGWVGMTYDLNPHLHELEPGLWAALGYSGRGIALATMMGRDLAARIAGASDAALAFTPVPLRSSPIRQIAKPLVGCLLNYYRALDAWDDRRHARGAE